ncbi:glycoside hydrolase family 18 [Thermoclostridium stercorarium subsp. stercorarium DSM 8532]|uniref:Glycoside hydrolase family 18 n=2 Tax=Thermoclostridium stercorarium TaxID=1510 RepID=L7VPA9_THES1|nr:LysM peptidoglycan-binding domain-containing protein [Thermoclostridium stercorarium]AGC67393.1 glycoside hydrolase family 18 [Thermoclostridium stercorarium subsp. stercorarium DSM 8532]AGI38453.1 chitinase [Thermoclostridium stercorarium subsp. stercorarium DSM 8532]ANW97884.1 glycosyl hydrolase [Thermoclostridium stercorarium subsp. thermolacticum DSM 2910]UZQ85982.1 LysM peptidoglycan-binding domain-containing protein [Thermoclostridium stercorarium]
MWYTVVAGDSLYQIARRFGTTVETLVEANKLQSTDLNIGQGIYIPPVPGRAFQYTVRAGDTLYGLARLFGTTIQALAELNGIENTTIYAGQRILIPFYTEVIVNTPMANVRNGPGTNFASVAVMQQGARLPVVGYRNGWYQVGLFNGTFGWISEDIVTLDAHDSIRPVQPIIGFYTLAEGPGLPGSYTSFADNVSQLSGVYLFFYQISRNDPTQIDRFFQFTDQDIRVIVAVAHRNNIKVLPVVHNLLYRPGGTALARDLVRQLVSSPQNRRAFAQNLVQLVERYNFDGVNIDIEDAYTEDSENLAQLYVDIAEAFRPHGYFLSASVPARISDEPFNPFSDPFDYATIGSAVDEFIVMLYNEYGWPGSPPGPPVSIPWMRRVLNYTKTKMPWYKIAAAVSVFGFDFNLTTNTSSYVSFDRAIQLAEQYGATIQFDMNRQTPWFSYTDGQGQQHQVWFENTDSIRAKVQTAWNMGINGIALWRLGMEDPGIWDMLANETVVKKIIENFR